jgi:hypothetical protein
MSENRLARQGPDVGSEGLRPKRRSQPMFALQHLHPWLAPFAGAAAFAWSLLAGPLPFARRPRTLREEDLSDWLLADIGWRDGRGDAAARRMRQRCDRPDRALV